MFRRVVLLALLTGTHLTRIDEAGYRTLVEASRGKVLLVDFWATWCEPCRAELPRLTGLERRLRGRGLRFVTVSTDEPEQEAEALRVLRDMRISGSYIREPGDVSAFINSVDPKWSGALPALFLYDRAGHLTKSFTGEVEIRDVERAIRNLL